MSKQLAQLRRSNQIRGSLARFELDWEEHVSAQKLIARIDFFSQYVCHEGNVLARRATVTLANFADLSDVLLLPERSPDQ